MSIQCTSHIILLDVGRFRLVAITLLHVQVDHSSFVTDKGIPKSNTTIQRGERVLRTCPLALENMALVAEFEVSVPDFRLFFKALQSSWAVRTQVLCPKHHGRHTWSCTKNSRTVTRSTQTRHRLTGSGTVVNYKPLLTVRLYSLTNRVVGGKKEK